MKTISKIAVIATALTTLGGAAYAAQSGGNDALAINQAKVSLSQAISAAEQQHSGKASKAEFEHSKSGWVYEIEVVSGDKVFDVKVDADKGTILSSAEDTVDRHEGRDDDHDDKD